MKTHPIKIISGGQTGADRAALDWALAHGIPHGGWCPRGRKAEDGFIPRRYRLTETRSAAYLIRTRWNLRDSDGTVIFSLASRLSGGTRRTAELAARLKKPLLVLGAKERDSEWSRRLDEFIVQHRIRVLNVAGPRVSEAPGIGRFVEDVLRQSRLLTRRRKKAVRT